jgi:formylmethanofuran dehydrogenase subunit D
MDSTREEQMVFDSYLMQNTTAAQGALMHLQHLTQEDTHLFTQILKTDPADPLKKIVNDNALVLFKQIYKPITVFASEQTYHENGTIYFGQGPIIDCRLSGEYVQSAFFTCTLKNLKLSNISEIEGQNAKIAYITNLGASMISALVDIGLPADSINSV